MTDAIFEAEADQIFILLLITYVFIHIFVSPVPSLGLCQTLGAHVLDNGMCIAHISSMNIADNEIWLRYRNLHSIKDRDSSNAHTTHTFLYSIYFININFQDSVIILFRVMLTDIKADESLYDQI